MGPTVVPKNPMWYEQSEGEVCPECDCDSIYNDKCENEDCGFEYDSDFDKMMELGL